MLRYLHDFYSVGLAVDGLGEAARVVAQAKSLEDLSRPIGTLCAASHDRTPIVAGAVDVMTMLARLIAGAWEREKRHAAALQQAAAAEFRLRNRALFLARAEHKLKTPLTILRGWCEVMEQDWDELSEEDRRKGLGTMHRATDEATQQVEQLLIEARAEVLSTHLRPETVAVGPLVEGILEELAGVAAA